MAQGTAVADERRARASARYVRMTPMKVRRVVDLIRGMEAREALSVLQFAPQAASEPVAKLLASAVANAEHNHQLDPESLVISAAYVDEGPTAKRFRPRAQGRAYRINKRTSHITIEVESVAPAAPARKAAPAKKAAPARAPAKVPAKAAAKDAAAEDAAAEAPATKASNAATAGPDTDEVTGTAAETAPANAPRARKAAKMTAEPVTATAVTEDAEPETEVLGTDAPAQTTDSTDESTEEGTR